jgi:hypothetical protein
MDYSLCLHNRADHAGPEVSLLAWGHEVCRHGVGGDVLKLLKTNKRALWRIELSPPSSTAIIGVHVTTRSDFKVLKWTESSNFYACYSLHIYQTTSFRYQLLSLGFYIRSVGI